MSSINSSSSKQNIESHKAPVISLYTSSQIEIYPDPFDTELNIEVSEDDGLSYLELIGENSNVVWESSVSGIPSTLYIQSISAGTYQLRLSLTGGLYTVTLEYQP